jgi:predicted ATPase with chaperone activity
VDVQKQVTQQTQLRELLRQPNTLEELNIPQSIVLDLILRLLFAEGDVTLRRFQDVLRLSGQLIDNIMLQMQKEHIVEIAKAGNIGRASYTYRLTEEGFSRARQAFDRCQYIGPVPINSEDYNVGILMQTAQMSRVSPEDIQGSIAHLILPDGFHRKIGPAVNAGTSLFLYGPPGNGKTTISEAIAKVIAGTDPIWLPHAITIGGQIIMVYDKLIHKPLELSREEQEQMGDYDRRWSRYERPTVMVGGELTMEALDLRYDEISKFYDSPLQLKANGGMFLIDDFGRQLMRPQDLLNRWIVPLESRFDFLRLRTGQTMQIPFRQLIVFSTNLDPNQLVDAAFLRRLQMKVKVDSPDERLFFQIFATVAQKMNIPLDKESFLHLLNEWYRKPGRVLQSVHPRDILKICKQICEYEGRPIQLNPALIDDACSSYFVD